MKNVVSKAARYWKGIVSLGGAVTITGQVLADSQVTAEEAGIVVTAFVTAAGVFLKSNAE